MMVKFVINYLGHDTDACSQVAEGVGQMLSPDRAGDGGGSLGLSSSPGEDRV